MSVFQILHISDLHVDEKSGFDRSVVLDPMIKRIKQDLEAGFNPEIVVVTGDIAYHGLEKEYIAAEKFFAELRSVLGLSKKHFFFVPGNHDVNRNKYRPTDIPSFADMKALNDELENEAYRCDLFKGLDEYFGFTETHYPHLKSRNPRLVPFVMPHATRDSKRIALVGLNSAWMCRKSPDEKTIAIGQYQGKKAVDELETLNKKGEFDLVINLFHHPLKWLWHDDKEICRTHMDGTVCLSGHIHEASGGCETDIYSRTVCELHAGAAYVGTGATEKESNSFQVIKIDFDLRKIMIHFRKYDIKTGNWFIEGDKGKDGVAAFDFPKKGGVAVDFAPVTIPEDYLNWVRDRCKHMELEQLLEKELPITVGLPGLVASW